MNSVAFCTTLNPSTGSSSVFSSPVLPIIPSSALDSFSINVSCFDEDDGFSKNFRKKDGWLFVTLDMLNVLPADGLFLTPKNLEDAFSDDEGGTGVSYLRTGSAFLVVGSVGILLSFCNKRLIDDIPPSLLAAVGEDEQDLFLISFKLLLPSSSLWNFFILSFIVVLVRRMFEGGSFISLLSTDF